MVVMFPDSEAQLRSQRARELIAWFEALRPDTLDSIAAVYATDARFRDPFNEVQGVQIIRTIYAHMFDSLSDPRFEIVECLEQGSRICMVWLFRFEWRTRRFEIEGNTLFDLDEQGLIARHRDYWDVAQGLYEHLPVLGRVLRLLRRRMSVHTSV